MNELPAGWALTTLGEIAETRLGKMLSKKARVGDGPQPYLRNKNVQWGRIELDDLLEMDFSEAELDRFRVIPGDLLVCEGGEVGRAAIWRGQLDWIGYQKALHRVRPQGGIAPDYLLYVLMWLADSHAFDPHVTGSTIKHLPQEDLRLLRVPLPPLNEQRRIVAAIEEQLSRLDAGDDMLSGARRRLESLRFVALRSALPPAPLRRLGDVASVVSGQTPKHLAMSASGPIPYFKVGDMNAADGHMMSTSRQYVTEEDAAGSKLRVHPIGTVVFPKRGGAIATNKKRLLATRAALDLNTMAIIPGPEVDPDYLYLYFETVDLESLADGSNVPQINHDDVTPLSIALPPLEEQRRIVAEVEAKLSALDALRASIERAQRRSKALRAAVLAKAFHGELVPQDPSDEPADALLSRIRADGAPDGCD
jgi:type I restriction enzyme S subunit